MIKLVLRFIAPGFLLAGLSHAFLGLGADAMLGAHVSPEMLADPTLDSQNRFYGASFTIYGILFWVAAGDIVRYRALLHILILWFFLGGLIRLVSVALRGWPSDMVWALALSELILPPILWWMTRREEQKIGEHRPT